VFCVLSDLTQEARDTLDLIDQLLWVLGPAGESGFVFFDLDETLITRDTSLIDGLGSTRFVSFRVSEAGSFSLVPLPPPLLRSSSAGGSSGPLLTHIKGLKSLKYQPLRRFRSPPGSFLEDLAGVRQQHSWGLSQSNLCFFNMDNTRSSPPC